VFRAGSIAQKKNTCLACTKPFSVLPSTEEKKVNFQEKKKTVLQNVSLVAYECNTIIKNLMQRRLCTIPQ
jgi:hypothetical protein